MVHPTLRRVLALLLVTLACWLPGTLALAADEPALPPGEQPPPTALSRLTAAGGADQHPGFDTVIVHDLTTTAVDQRGVATTDTTVLYKVLTPAGCRSLAALGWRFDPQSSAVSLVEAAVIRGGERIPVDVASALDLPAPQAAIYWSDRLLLLQLPRLAVGDGIEVRTRRQGFTYALLAAESSDDRFVPPMPGEFFDLVLFAAEVPILEKRYELRLPAGKRLHSQVYNGALFSSTTYDQSSTTFAWWGRDLLAQPDEPRMPDASDVVTKVVLATVESWEAKSRWFFGVNEGQFASSPEIDAKVREILAAAEVSDGSDDAKAEALLHWVAQNIRYSGQTMGKGEGFTLHPGSMIFEQRSGVCKDIAGMLVTMLRAADIPTYAAMTMAGSRIESVPADQFNHCVVARRDGDRFVMYDPTWVPYNRDIWSKLETEQHYLVGSPQGEMLTRIPYSPPEESPLRVRHQARLAADGSLEGSIRLEGSGAMDGRLRRLLYGTGRRELRDRMAHLLEPMATALSDVRVRHPRLDDFSADMWLELSYRASGFALPVGEGLELASPTMGVLLGERYLFGAGHQEWKSERRADAFLYHTQLLDLEETIELPSGYTVAELPPASEVDTTYASFTGSCESAAGRLTLRARSAVKRRQIPPAGYAGLREVVEAARKWGREPIRLEAGGER